MIDKLKQIWEEHRSIIILSTGMLIAGLIAGLFMPVELKQQVLQGVEAKVSEVWSADPFTLFLQIFLNNIFVAFFMLLSGLTIVIPIVVVFLNGAVISVVLESAVRDQGVGSFPLIAAMLPHGIFEIPALLLTASMSAAIGLKLFFGRHFMRRKTFLQVFRQSFSRFIRVVMLLFLIAAFIEAFITPVMVEAVDESGECRFECRDLGFETGECLESCDDDMGADFCKDDKVCCCQGGSNGI